MARCFLLLSSRNSVFGSQGRLSSLLSHYWSCILITRIRQPLSSLVYSFVYSHRFAPIHATRRSQRRKKKGITLTFCSRIACVLTQDTFVPPYTWYSILYSLEVVDGTLIGPHTCMPPVNSKLLQWTDRMMRCALIPLKTKRSHPRDSRSPSTGCITSCRTVPDTALFSILLKMLKLQSRAATRPCGRNLV